MPPTTEQKTPVPKSFGCRRFLYDPLPEEMIPGHGNGSINAEAGAYFPRILQ